METSSANTTAISCNNTNQQLPTQNCPPSGRPIKRGKTNSRKYHGPKKFKTSDLDDATYIKAAIPPSLSVQPLRTYFTLYTTNNGLPAIANDVYQCLVARIRGIAQVISLPQFKYVVDIVWLARLVEVAVAHGTCYPRESSKLIKTARAIQLPQVLCRYIETLGKVDMMSGAAVLPYCADYRDLIPLGTEYYYDPLEAIQDGERPDPGNEWSIDEDWITSYVQATSRIFRTGVDVRTISRELVGSSEILVGYRNISDIFEPISCERLSVATAEIGAAYRLREYAEPLDWPFGDNFIAPALFVSTPINPDLVISDATSRSFNPSRMF